MKGAWHKGALLGAALLASGAFALPKYRLQAIQTFHYDQGNPLWKLDRQVMPCTYCHVNERGGAPWNPFGNALREQFRQDAQQGKRHNVSQTLLALLAAQKDSDGDGYTDALEVFSRTLPGDPRSFPQQSAEQVQQAFAKVGSFKLWSETSK